MGKPSNYVGVFGDGVEHSVYPQESGSGSSSTTISSGFIPLFQSSVSEGSKANAASSGGSSWSVGGDSGTINTSAYKGLADTFKISDTTNKTLSKAAQLGGTETQKSGYNFAGEAPDGGSLAMQGIGMLLNFGLDLYKLHQAQSNFDDLLDLNIAGLNAGIDAWRAKQKSAANLAPSVVGIGGANVAAGQGLTQAQAHNNVTAAAAVGPQHYNG